MKQLYCTHALNLELRLRLVLQSSSALLILCLRCSVSWGWRKANSNAHCDLMATNPTQASDAEGYSSVLPQSSLPPTLHSYLICPCCVTDKCREAEENLQGLHRASVLAWHLVDLLSSHILGSIFLYRTSPVNTQTCHFYSSV